MLNLSLGILSATSMHGCLLKVVKKSKKLFSRRKSVTCLYNEVDLSDVNSFSKSRVKNFKYFYFPLEKSEDGE